MSSAAAVSGPTPKAARRSGLALLGELGQDLLERAGFGSEVLVAVRQRPQDPLRAGLDRAAAGAENGAFLDQPRGSETLELVA